jgi:hypothetical protein
MPRARRRVAYAWRTVAGDRVASSETSIASTSAGVRSASLIAPMAGLMWWRIEFS